MVYVITFCLLHLFPEVKCDATFYTYNRSLADTVYCQLNDRSQSIWPSAWLDSITVEEYEKIREEQGFDD